MSTGSEGAGGAGRSSRDRADDRIAGMAAVVALGMIAQQIASKAVRDTLFLGSYDAEELPQAMLLSAALALVGVMGISPILRAKGPARVVPALFAVSAVLYVIEASLVGQAPGLAAYVLYLHVGVFGSMVVSGFWSVVNERFDPHSAKRRIARIASGATLGGVIGGLLAERITTLFGTSAALPALAVLTAICGVGVAVLGRGSSGPVGRKEETVSGVGALRGSPYLRRIAGVVVLLAVVSALVDFALKAQADVELQSQQELATFFSVYYTGLALATFLVQSFASKAALERLGIGGSLMLLPVMVLAASALGTIVARLWSVVALRGVAAVLESSVHRSAYELLYTPVAPREKRPSKILIDVAGNRLGDAIGSVLVLGLLAVVGGAAEAVTSSVVAGGLVAAAALVVIARLQRGYVEQLASSLRRGDIELGEDVVADATTRKTLAETTVALNREKLLAEIEALRQKQLEAAETGDADAPAPSVPPPSTGDALRDRVLALRSGEPDQVRRALAQPVDDALMPEVLPLLEGELRRPAERALRRAAARHLGQLIDALLDDRRPLEVRARLADVVASVAKPRAVDGLFLALEDPRFEVRYRAARALAGIVARHPNLRPSQERVYAAATREVEVGRRVWESQRLLSLGDETARETDELAAVLRERKDRSLEHVFTILGLALDRNTLRLALAALMDDATEMRGTALEYLENVLPERIRRGLWPYVGGGTPGRREKRPKEQIVDELLRSMDSIRVSRDAILAAASAASVPPSSAPEPDADDVTGGD
ncbi:MAG: Npt1/Npt2 family nucleotide transporter [Myxococcota bacterium]